MLTFINRAGVFFFCVMAFFLPIAPAVLETSFGFIFLLCIIRMIIAPPGWLKVKSFLVDRQNLSLLFFFIAVGLTLLVTVCVKKSFNTWIFKWGEGFLLFYFASVFLNRDTVKIFLKIFSMSAFLLAVAGIYQFISGIDFIHGKELLYPNGHKAITAAFGHYNNFGAYAAPALLILTGMVMQETRLRNKIFYFGAISLLSIDLVFTYSRGSWLALLCGLSFVGFFLPRGKVQLWAFAGVIIFILVIFLIPFTRERFALIWQHGGDSNRYKLWCAAWRMFLESPLLGKGAGTYSLLLPQYCPGFPGFYTHNCYLQILAETGIAGLVTLVWFIVELFIRARRCLAVYFDFVQAGLIAAMSVFLAHAFFDVHFYSIRFSLYFWLMAICLNVYAQAGCNEPEK